MFEKRVGMINACTDAENFVNAKVLMYSQFKSMIVLSCDDRRTPNLFHYLSTTPSRIMHMIIDTHWYYLNATFDVRTSITTVLK